MKILYVSFFCLMLSGCFYGKNLTPEQLTAIGELAKIKKVSFCGRLGVEGSGGFIGGEGGFVVCGGTKEPLDIDQANQFMNGISINVD